MRRFVFAAIVMAIAVLATALPAYAASAILTVGSTSGNPVANGDKLTSGLKSGTTATFTNTQNSNQLTCKVSSFNATAGNNPAPGGGNTASESLTSQTFDTTSGDPNRCTTNFGPTVNSITIDNLPYNVSVADPGSGTNVTLKPGSNGIIHATVVVQQIFTFTCKYKVHDTSGDLFGTTNNSDNSLTFSGQQFDLESGPNVCFPSAKFSAAYAPVQDTSQSNGNVFTN